MRTLKGFVQDVSGSVSIYTLGWFTGFCMFVGLAIDSTAAFHAKEKIQWAADAAAHAAVMDIFPLPVKTKQTAPAFTKANLKVDGVVVEADVTPGYWDKTARTFSHDAETIPFYNAVHVTSHRDRSRANALATTFLYFAGVRDWDLNMAAIAHYGEDIDETHRCRQNGLIAGGLMEQTSNNTLTNNICVHGETEFKINQNNIVTCGVQLSTPGAAMWKTGQAPAGNDGTCNEDYGNLTNDQMISQSLYWTSLPSMAQAEYNNMKKILDAYVADEEGFNDFFNAIPPYIETVLTVDVGTFNALPKPVPGVLYRVNCGASNTRLKLKGIIQNVGIYTDCEIDVQKDQSVSALQSEKDPAGSKKNCKKNCDDEGGDEVPNLPPDTTCEQAVANGMETYATLLDTVGDNTYRDRETQDGEAQLCGIVPGASGIFDNVFIFTTANEDGHRHQTSITFPNDMQIGRMDACTEGGGARIYAGGSVHTPSGTTIFGSHMILLGDSHMAAKANGVYGVTVEAAGDIKYTAQGLMGGCDASEELRQSDVVLTVRPIALVD